MAGGIYGVHGRQLGANVSFIASGGNDQQAGFRGVLDGHCFGIAGRGAGQTAGWAYIERPGERGTAQREDGHIHAVFERVFERADDLVVESAIIDARRSEHFVAPQVGLGRDALDGVGGTGIALTGRGHCQSCSVADVVTRRIIIGPRSGGIRGRKRLHVTAGYDHFMVGEGAIGGRALGEAGGNRQRVVLKRCVVLIDTAVYDRDFHAQARFLISAQRVPGTLCVHQYGCAIQLGLHTPHPHHTFDAGQRAQFIDAVRSGTDEHSIQDSLYGAGYVEVAARDFTAQRILGGQDTLAVTLGNGLGRILMRLRKLAGRRIEENERVTLVNFGGVQTWNNEEQEQGITRKSHTHATPLRCAWLHFFSTQGLTTL